MDELTQRKHVHFEEEVDGGSAGGSAKKNNDTSKNNNHSSKPVKDPAQPSQAAGSRRPTTSLRTPGNSPIASFLLVLFGASLGVAVMLLYSSSDPVLAFIRESRLCKEPSSLLSKPALSSNKYSDIPDARSRTLKLDAKFSDGIDELDRQSSFETVSKDINVKISSQVDVRELSFSDSQKPQSSDSPEPQSSDPQQPQSSDPQQPQSSDPQQPQTSDPQHPQQPQSSDPQQPQSSDPQQPQSSDPQEPQTSDPQQPQSSDSQEPQTSDPQQPQSSDSQEPQSSDPQEPQSSDPQEPQTSDPQQPQSSDPQEPQTSDPQPPQSSDSQQPQASDPQQPQASDPQQPQSSDSQQPQASDPQQPQSSDPQERQSSDSSQRIKDVPLRRIRLDEGSGPVPVMLYPEGEEPAVNEPIVLKPADIVHKKQVEDLTVDEAEDESRPIKLTPGKSGKIKINVKSKTLSSNQRPTSSSKQQTTKKLISQPSSEDDLMKQVKEFQPTIQDSIIPKKIFDGGRRIPPIKLIHINDNNSTVQIYVFNDLMSAMECDRLREVHNKYVTDLSKNGELACFDSVRTLRAHLKDAGKTDVYVTPNDFTPGTKCLNATFSAQFKTWTNANWSHSTAFYPGESRFSTVLERRIESTTGLKPSNGGKYQITSYAKGIGYKNHTDCTLNSDEKRDRFATVLIYLDDVAEGGETKFPKLGIWVRPRKGRMLVWTNMDSTGRCEPESQHFAASVVEGKKYILQRWYYYKSFYSLGRRPPEPRLPQRELLTPRVNCDEYEHGSCRWYDEWTYEHLTDFNKKHVTLI